MSFVHKSREAEAVSNRTAHSASARSLRIGDANDASEREADRVATEVTSARRVAAPLWAPWAMRSAPPNAPAA